MKNNDNKVIIDSKTNTIDYTALFEVNIKQLTSNSVQDIDHYQAITALQDCIDLNQDVKENYLNFQVKSKELDMNTIQQGYSLYFSIYCQLSNMLKDFPKLIVNPPLNNKVVTNKRDQLEVKSNKECEETSSSIEQLTEDQIEEIIKNDPYYLLILQHLPKFMSNSESMTTLELFIPNKVTNILRQLRNKKLKGTDYHLVVYEHTYFSINLIYHKPKFFIEKICHNVLHNKSV